jgi:hypothetical protein
MAANANVLYNIISGTPPAALYTHPNTNFTWVGFAAGQVSIYAAGFSGSKSLIYKTAVKADGSALDIPVVCGELPDGEIVRSISGYLGNLLIGTDLGFRFATVDASGNLNIGTRIVTSSAVQCFTPQANFVWFGWTNYDTSSTGLGRLDISHFTDQTDTSALTPAYASDLMATTQNAVTSVVTFQTLRAFTVSGVGVFAEITNKVASGTMTTGNISYGVPDDKTTLYLDTHCVSFPVGATISPALSTDTGAFVSLSTISTMGANQAVQVGTGQSRGGEFEIQYTLTRGTDVTAAPILNRWTLKSFPTTNDGTGETLQVPLLIGPRIDVHGEEYEYDVDYEINVIKGLRSSRKVTTLQELTTSYVGFVEDYRWVPHHLIYDQRWRATGTMVIQFKRIA